MEYENLKLNRQICHRVYAASNGIIRLYKNSLDKLNLTYPQYITMLALWELEEANIKEIQALSKIDGGSLSLILKKLEKKKLIKIKHSEQDKRKKVCSLTKDGLKKKEMAKDVPMTMFHKIGNFSKEEIFEMVRLLDKMNAKLYPSS